MKYWKCWEECERWKEKKSFGKAKWTEWTSHLDGRGSERGRKPLCCFLPGPLYLLISSTSQKALESWHHGAPWGARHPIFLESKWCVRESCSSLWLQAWHEVGRERERESQLVRLFLGSQWWSNHVLVHQKVMLHVPCQEPGGNGVTAPRLSAARSSSENGPLSEKDPRTTDIQKIT